MLPVHTISPVGGVTQAVVPADRLAPAPALALPDTTDVAAGKSVAAVAPAAATANDTSSSSNVYQRTVHLDAATQELIFRVVDVRTRQVVRQIPEDALLRLRAYAHALNEGKSNTEALNQANIEV
jgi:hypothetical protein